MQDEHGGSPPPPTDAERFELLGRVAGGVAHDLNNQLSTVTTLADLLLARCDPGSPTAADLEEIKAAGMTAAETLRRLQLFARPGRHAPEMLDVVHVTRSMEPLLGRLLGPAVDVRISENGRVPPVCAPSARIEELLLGIAGMARRALLPGGGSVILGIGGRTTASAGVGAVVTLEAILRTPEAAIPSERLALLHGLVTDLSGSMEVRPDVDGGARVLIALPAAE